MTTTMRAYPATRPEPGGDVCDTSHTQWTGPTDACARAEDRPFLPRHPHTVTKLPRPKIGASRGRTPRIAYRVESGKNGSTLHHRRANRIARWWRHPNRPSLLPVLAASNDCGETRTPREPQHNTTAANLRPQRNGTRRLRLEADVCVGKQEGGDERTKEEGRARGDEEGGIDGTRRRDGSRGARRSGGVGRGGGGDVPLHRSYILASAARTSSLSPTTTAEGDSTLCFYTVSRSRDLGDLADLRVQPTELGAVLVGAQRVPQRIVDRAVRGAKVIS
ncbi:hypothetical protein R3P38DRAFT_3450529 [Favolaschia claudopus]|uniref:Uncharacterized protein n=1 Tax=Favolaschia claudopus TaxID=2862362 RepID=A0AAV9ZLL4_9AGAR